jgi:hypothetical protein
LEALRAGVRVHASNLITKSSACVLDSPGEGENTGIGTAAVLRSAVPFDSPDKRLLKRYQRVRNGA